MAKRTNIVMQVTFFALALDQLLPKEEALKLLRNDIKTRFRFKSDRIIKNNLKMVDQAESSL